MKHRKIKRTREFAVEIRYRTFWTIQPLLKALRLFRVRRSEKRINKIYNGIFAEYYIKNGIINLEDTCPCGSGHTFKDCCSSVFNEKGVRIEKKK